MQLYDLAGADPARRFSPFCWRVKLALAHKGLAVETIPWRFTDTAEIAFSEQGRVPVLVDGSKTIVDSWTIATYLDDTYVEKPALFGGQAAAPLTRFINTWTDRALHPALAPLILTDIYAHIHAKDREYFRTSREKMFGKSLEELSADRDSRVHNFRAVLEPLRSLLQVQEYLAGATPAYADYIAFSAFQWARCISPFRLLMDDDPVAHWRKRMLDACDGLANDAVAYPV